MNIIHIHRLFKLPARHHSAGRLDAGSELRAADVPVVAAERVGVADAIGVFVDFAVGGRPAEARAFGFGGCEGGGSEEEEEEGEEILEGRHGCEFFAGGRIGVAERKEGREGRLMGLKNGMGD